MILLDLSYDSCENEVLLPKTESRVLDFWFLKSLTKVWGPICTRFKTPDHKFHSSGTLFFYPVKFHKILHEPSSTF